jgi:hypothetical protein
MAVLRMTTTTPLPSAGFDQLQHLGPETNGPSLAIEGLENCLGRLFNVASLSTEPGPLQKLGGVGKQALAIWAVGAAGMGTPQRWPRTSGAGRGNRQGPRASDGLHV